jgi:hypothetical protein
VCNCTSSLALTAFAATVPARADTPQSHRRITQRRQHARCLSSTVRRLDIDVVHATEVPEVEVELEGSSEQLLIYWLFEMTFAPPGARRAASIRLHHRSKGFGLLAEEGGMNALAAGIRLEF